MPNGLPNGLSTSIPNLVDDMLNTFREAKAVALSWVPEEHTIRATSLHSWENDETLRGGRTTFPVAPVPCSDPQVGAPVPAQQPSPNAKHLIMHASRHLSTDLQAGPWQHEPPPPPPPPPHELPPAAGNMTRSEPGQPVQQTPFPSQCLHVRLLSSGNTWASLGSPMLGNARRVY